MATVTALDLITASLIKIRVHRSGATVPNEDAQDALDELNRLLESLALENWPIYRVVNMPHALTPGTGSLTLGPAGAVNTVRPLALQDSYTEIGGLSYPYAVIGVDQWNLIGRKSQTGTAAQLVYYDPAYPLGVAYLWPVPSGGGTLHLQAVQQWSALSIVEVLSMPPGYRDFLVHRLGKRLAPSYGAVLGGEFLEEARRIDLAIYRQRKQPVIAEVSVPFFRGTDPTWVFTGGV